MFWLTIWTLCGGLSLLLYGLVSFWFDRHLVLSTWIKAWLALMLLLGPLGTLLTLRFLLGLSRDIRNELRRRGLGHYPRPTRIYDAQARSHYVPPFATRRLGTIGRRPDRICPAVRPADGVVGN